MRSSILQQSWTEQRAVFSPSRSVNPTIDQQKFPYVLQTQVQSSSPVNTKEFCPVENQAEKAASSNGRLLACLRSAGCKNFAIGAVLGSLFVGIALSAVTTIYISTPNITTTTNEFNIGILSASTSMTTSTSTSVTSTSSTTSTTSGSSITYSQSFTSGATPSSQCSAWTAFQSQLISNPYTSLTMQGTYDPIGITLTNATYILAIANALLTSSSYGPVSSNGYSWAVGVCGSGYELTATGSICACNTGYTLRPCIGNSNWGAINGATCSGSTQTMTAIFQ